MAALAKVTRSATVCSRIFASSRPLSTSFIRHAEGELETHTGQKFLEDDYRKARFLENNKLVNTRFAVDLIAEDPVVVCEQRVVWSDSTGALGHPKVFINLDPPGVHVCGYSGRKFVHKKQYDEKTMGPSITYEQYLEEMKTPA